MTQRKEVFQSKVLQRLFPAAPKLDKEPSPPCIVEALAKKTFVKRKKAQEDTAADYKTHPEKSVTLSQLESINSAKDPAEESVHESNEELDQDKEQEEHKRKRKRRKRKPGPHQDSGQDGAAPGQSQTVAVVEGGEHISRNKKRKLKKKRHKEKLLSMGEMPRAAALVFTYQKDGGEEEEDNDNERRAAEVSDFLRTTLEIYLSDPKLHVENKSPRLSSTVDNLLSHISSGCEPNSVLKQLYSLKTSVQHKETAKLEKALQELHNSSSMTAGQYWYLGKHQKCKLYFPRRASDKRNCDKAANKSFSRVKCCFVFVPRIYLRLHWPPLARICQGTSLTCPCRRIRCRRFTVPILDHRYPSHAGRQDEGTFYHTPMRLSVTLKQRRH
ncbi:uncharacterized protein erich1 isoform X2 [Paralichthys olivaceus]|uniref:uncharacterized protein erich1 isoform X2 n=1 Tax=Paralichthys olivaceus TaxID=8255 RepID=UPI003750938D